MSSHTKAKERLHTIWITAKNVTEEMYSYQAKCELGSVLGAKEEVDLKALKENGCVRFKIHVKIISKIPPIIEVGVKPYMYVIFLKIDNMEKKGWNDEYENLGKRASIETYVTKQKEENISEKRATWEKSEGGSGIIIPEKYEESKTSRKIPARQ